MAEDIAENVAKGKDVKDIRDALLASYLRENIRPERMVSSSSTLLNLAATGTSDGFLAMGNYCWLCGSSSAGKTWLLLSMLASAANNPNFDKYRLIYDNVEGGASMDIERYFGSKLVNRLESPVVRDGEPQSSISVEDFYFNLDDLQKERKPFFYVLDSMSALGSLASDETFEENKKIHQRNQEKGTDKDLKGSYGDGVAKINSQNIRRVVSKLRDTGSILVIVTQLRDNIGGYGESQVAGGGRALKFYAHTELWMNPKAVLKQTISGKERAVGTLCQAVIKKNRYTGMRSDVLFPIYNSYGIDDAESMLTWLEEEGVVLRAKGAQSIEIPQLGVKGKVSTVITQLEEADRMGELRQLAVDTWTKITEKMDMGRKPKFA